MTRQYGRGCETVANKEEGNLGKSVIKVSGTQPSGRVCSEGQGK